MGIDNIEHGCFDFTDKVEDDLNGPRTDDLVSALVQKGVVLTATPTNARKPLSAFAVDVLESSGARAAVESTRPLEISAACSGRHRLALRTLSDRLCQGRRTAGAGSDAGGGDVSAGGKRRSRGH